MEAHPRRLKTVFRTDVRLVVPLFQRPYVWDEDEQWAPLWDDVVAAFDRRQGGETPPHFLGAIVLEQKRGALGSLEVREVIDGQQRLTTLQILIAALRDSYDAAEVKTRLRSHLVKTLVNDLDYVDSVDEEFKLWPTNRDRQAYVGVMRGEYRDSASAPSLPRIAAAYVFFRECVDVFVAENADTVTVLDGLAEVILEHLEMVVIDLGPDDNSQVIFETLNARGTALRAADLIKNALFRTLQDHGRPVEVLYQKYWEALEQPHWQQMVRQGRLLRPRLDVYIGFFLALLQHREVPSHQLFTTSRNYFGGDADLAEDYLAELHRYAGIFDELEQKRIGTPAEGYILSRLEIVDTQTIVPVLLWLFAHTDGLNRERSLTLLESYLVRRAVCRLTAKNYNRLFAELLRRLAVAAGPADQVVESFLLQQDSESGQWPSDTELAESLAGLPLYRLFIRERLQRLLLAFEQHLTTDRTEAVPPSKKLSVEHLLPQSWQEHWPLPPGDGAAAEEELRDNVLHTIGNLTLVTGKLNSSLSNGPWASKHRHLLAHSALTLNRALPGYWDGAAISARSAMFARAAALMWPRPAGAAPARTHPIAFAERDLAPDRAAVQLRPQRNSPARRDIGQHIRNAFADLPVGTFLTVSEIRKVPSAQYPADDLPSAGAIHARLFRGTAYSTVAGVTGAVADGRKGGRRTD